MHVKVVTKEATATRTMLLDGTLKPTAIPRVGRAIYTKRNGALNSRHLLSRCRQLACAQFAIAPYVGTATGGGPA